MKITWLHLSDLHFKSGHEFEKFNQKIVLEKLWIDIQAQIKKGLRPDFIVFSGDITYNGKNEEYILTKEHFFDPLLKITGVPKGKLFIVPGNHDIDWNLLDHLTEGGMISLLSERNKINQFLSGEQDRSYVFKRFNAYAEFINQYFDNQLNFSEKEYYYTRVLTIRECKVAILGLNSIWMSGCNKDRHGKVNDNGFLFIGEWQIEKALRETENADYRIAILHHPTDWLHEIDRFNIEKLLDSNCHFILHGHWHLPQVNYRHSMSGRAVYIPCGAVYAGREFPNGYNIVEFDIESGQAKIYLRRYNDSGPKGPEWTRDILSTGDAKDGVLEFIIFKEEINDRNQRNESKKILLIEDDLEWQKLIKSLLIPPDFDLEITTSFAEAVPLIQEISFDLIIINLSLHGENDFEGVAILDELIKKGSNPIPCIVLTGTPTSTRGLYDRYNVCEIFIKGGKVFNRANFLKAVNDSIISNV